MRSDITPLLLTYNEEPNIARTLERLHWATEIIVIDSFSTDKTLEILSSDPRIQVYQRKFDTFANQCNYGLTKITSDWVLSMDADYVLSQSLVEELQSLEFSDEMDAYAVGFVYCVFGKPLRATLLPPRKVLYRREKARYEEDGHAHQVSILGGRVSMLKNKIEHDDRKSLSRWIASQDKYMIIEAKKITETPAHELSFPDRIRKKKILAPFVVFFYCLFVKKGILDGRAGWYYVFQRTFAEILLSIRLLEAGE